VLGSHRTLCLVVIDSVLDHCQLSWVIFMLYLFCGLIISGLCCPAAFFTFLGVAMSVSALFTPNSEHFFHICLVLLLLGVTCSVLYYTLFLFSWYTISISLLELLVVITVLILVTRIAVDLVDCTLSACRVVSHFVCKQTTWPMRWKS
jgi:hypothetical protein